MCAELDSGVEATDIGLDILRRTPTSNTRQAAAFIVMSIGYYYCPQHTGAFGERANRKSGTRYVEALPQRSERGRTMPNRVFVVGVGYDEIREAGPT